jgi:hypothetical protein
MIDTTTLADIDRAAQKAVRLFLAERTVRDGRTFREDVRQEAVCQFYGVTSKYDGTPAQYGPTCEGSTFAEPCQDHESCAVRESGRPSDVVLAKWAAVRAVQQVVRTARDLQRADEATRERMAAEDATTMTPDAHLVRVAPKSRKPVSAFASTLRTAHAGTDEAWHHVTRHMAEDFPTLAALIDVQQESTGGRPSGGWSALARAKGKDSGAMRAALKRQGEAEWARFSDMLDTLRGACESVALSSSQEGNGHAMPVMALFDNAQGRD